MRITITQRGSFKNSERWLNRMKRREMFRTLNKYGAIGMAALSSATPRDTGLLSSSWSYEIQERSGYYSIHWTNSDIVDGRPIAILLQYGHGTRQGGYVQGRDYIMPAIRPIFDRMADEAWKEVIR